MSEVVDAVVRALREGKLVVLPTDTVYGLTCIASSEQATAELYRLKGRDAIQPTAIVYASIKALFESLPELDGIPAAAARALLPGAYTLVIPDARGRYAWLSGNRPGALGVRVPELPAPTAAIVAQVGAVVATSANLPGGHDPCRLEDVPARILEGVAAALDGGALPGTPSTVIDLTGAAPVVLRVGGGDPETALEVIRSASGG